VTVTRAYLITSRVRGAASVVTPTTSPLVALYSAPACRAGYLRVQFRPAALGDAPWTSTAAQPCQPGRSLTFLVAGMRAQTPDLTAVWPVSIVPGGTVLLLGRDRSHSRGENVLREIDLAGHPLRETNIDALNAQLAVRRLEPINSLDHEALRLPNGYTAILGTT